METATACVIVKDEAPYLAEWLSHYLTLGFDRICVYNNGSSDNSAAIVRACSESHPQIRLVDWPDRAGDAPQLTAYAHALAHADTGWLAYFDADELLVLTGFESIGEFLARYGDDAGAVAINWRIFCSSGEQFHRDLPQAIRFRRSKKNDMLKSIVRVSHVEDMHVHGARLKRGRYYNDCVEPIELQHLCHTPTVSYRFAQVNHYVLRSAEEYREKRARGYAALARGDQNYEQRDEEFWQKIERGTAEGDQGIDVWVLRSEPLRERFNQVTRALGPARLAPAK